MAFRDVDPDPDYGKKKFQKMKDTFPTPGSQFVGLYQSDAEGTYGQEYTFKNRQGELVTLSPIKGQLLAQLRKAKIQPGEKVTILYTADQDVGKDSPMRLFKVRVEDAPKGAAKPPPKPAPEPGWGDGDDDIPF